MSSSSSDSEDENIALLQQAVDTNFICDGLFNKDTSSTPDKTATSSKETRDDETSGSAKSNKLALPLKSQRFIEHEEIDTDLNVPKSMQDFIYKKMTKKIEDSIEFVEAATKKSKKRKGATDDTACVRLLSNTDPITKIDFEPTNVVEPINRRKYKVKRRNVEPDPYDEEEKLKMASIDGECVLQQIDTKNWKTKKNKSRKMFNYREKKSVLYAVEPDNEFSTLRKKNNWSESKIANFPWKNQMNNL